MCYKHLLYTRLLAVAAITGIGFGVPAIALAAPQQTTPADGVTCHGLLCDNTNDRPVKVTGTMGCGGSTRQNSPQIVYFTATLKPDTTTQVPNPDCPDGRPGLDAFFPDM